MKPRGSTRRINSTSSPVKVNPDKPKIAGSTSGSPAPNCAHSQSSKRHLAELAADGLHAEVPRKGFHNMGSVNP